MAGRWIAAGGPPGRSPAGPGAGPAGKAAAGAMVIVTHGVAGIYWVGTHPDARGKGLAELCTRAAGNAGFDLGARIAGLQASVMGEPVYRRMGYVEVTRYPTFVRMEPPASA